MNENVLSFIKWGAGIVVTLAIISIAFIVFNMAKDSTISSTNEINDINSQIAESKITIYEGTVISGSDVVGVIRKFNGDYLGIQVKTGKNTSGTWYGYNVTIDSDGAIITNTALSTVSDAVDETSNDYVNPNGKFLGKVYRDANGTITAITFTQQ